MTIPTDLAFCRWQEGSDHAEKGGFARTIWTNQAKQAWTAVQAYVANGPQISISFAKTLTHQFHNFSPSLQTFS